LFKEITSVVTLNILNNENINYSTLLVLAIIYIWEGSLQGEEKRGIDNVRKIKMMEEWKYLHSQRLPTRRTSGSTAGV
jgi:hypothetical protein